MQTPATKLSDSQINKWRTLVALAHVDGQVSADEQNFVLSTLKKRNIDPEQLDVIMRDFETPRDPSEFFNKISDPRVRGILFYTARLMFFKDGGFCDYEKMYYEKFKAQHLASIDMAKIMAEVEKIRSETPEPTEGSWTFRHFQSIVDRYF